MSEVLPALRAAILSVHPELRDGPMVLNTMGWDSDAVEAGGLLFKFPKTEVAAERLRREARYLDLIRPRVPLRVPQLTVHTHPLRFSEHQMIPGRTIEAAHYKLLPDAQRDAMAETLAAFYAALHAIAPREALAAGAIHIPDWPPPRAIVADAERVLPPSLHTWIHRVLAAYAALPPDEDVTGYFDGHGWNMAFDHERGALNGVFDFADGGIGPRRREFCYGNLVSPDLADRTVAHYSALTGVAIDRRTVALHTAVQKLSEAEDPGGNPAAYVDGVIAWHDVMARDPALAV